LFRATSRSSSPGSALAGSPISPLWDSLLM
jgi:hypothetical protein